MLPGSGKTAAAERVLVGVVAGVEGTVLAQTDPRNKRVLAAGDYLYQGDTIVSREDGCLEIFFVDEASLKRGPDGVLKLDHLVFKPHDPQGRFAVSLDRGIVRFYSGSQANEAYRIKTPSLNIAVKGTVFDVVVGGDGTSTVLLRKGKVELSNRSGAKRMLRSPGRVSTARRISEAPSEPRQAAAALIQSVRQLDRAPGSPGDALLRAPDTAASSIEPSDLPARIDPPAETESLLPPTTPKIKNPKKVKKADAKKGKHTATQKSPPRPRFKPKKIDR